MAYCWDVQQITIKQLSKRVNSPPPPSSNADHRQRCKHQSATQPEYKHILSCSGEEYVHSRLPYNSPVNTTSGCIPVRLRKPSKTKLIIQFQLNRSITTPLLRSHRSPFCARTDGDAGSIEELAVCIEKSSVISLSWYWRAGWTVSIWL